MTKEAEKQRRLADIEVLRKYKTQVAAFRRFCVDVVGKEREDDPFEETDFNGVALGFFAALGVRTDDLDDPEVDPDLFHLARICRYKFEYWEGALGEVGLPEPLYFMLDENGKIVVEDENGKILAHQK